MNCIRNNSKIGGCSNIFREYKILRKYKGFHWIFKEDYNKLFI